jgi:anti-anti-sigma factor
MGGEATRKRATITGSSRPRATATARGPVSTNRQSWPPLTIDVERAGSRVLMTAVGEVDISTVDELERALAVAGETGAAEVFLDLTRMTFLDCLGLRTLLHHRARLLEEKRRLLLICPTAPVLRLLALTGTRGEFEIRPTAPPVG